MWDAQLEAIDARGGDAEWTGNGYREAPSRQLAVTRTPAPPAPVYRPPIAPASTFAVGGRAGTDPPIAGYDPDRAPLGQHSTTIAVNAVTMQKQFEANATASINLLAREVASLKREVAELKQPSNMPLWQKFLMALGSGVLAYAQRSASSARSLERQRASASRSTRWNRG
jgi:hypothetical protein